MLNNSLPIFAPFEVSDNINTLSHRWKKWVDKLENLMYAMDIEDSKKKRAMLKHYMGDEAEEIFATLPNTGVAYETAIAALNHHFSTQQNTDYEIYEFRQIKQKEGESLDQFVTRLRRASATCAFVDDDKEIKGQILQGCFSSRLRRYALQTPNIMLSDLLKYGRANEAADRHVQAIEQAATSVNLMNTRPKQKMENQRDRNKISKQPNYKNNKESDTRKKICQFCGEEWHFEGLQNCRARGKTCNFCRKPNHFSKVCKKKNSEHRNDKYRNDREPGKARQGETTYLVEQRGESDNDDYVLINFNQSKNEYETVKLHVNDIMIAFIIDTGSTTDILHENDFIKLHPRPILQPTLSNTYVFGATKPLKILGVVNLKVKYKNNEYQLSFKVTREAGPSLVGKRTATLLNLVQFLHNIRDNIRDTCEETEIIKQYQDLFKGVGKHKTTQVSLHIDDTVQPKIQKHRRIPFHVRTKVEQEINELLKDDIIEEVPNLEPTTWLSPIVALPKKNDPSKVRICVDMRQANTAIKRERHITPTLDDVIYDLNKAQYFSKLDLNKGYHQFELHKDSRHVTTFSTHLGMFRYKRLNFGINSAAEIFQHEVQKTIQGIPNVMNVSDDILIYGETMEQHNNALKATLDRLLVSGLTLNKNKCKFGKRKLKFLGHVFSNKGIQPDNDKILAIQKITAPENATEVRSFLGMSNFCAKFIPEMAQTTAPLRQLIKKKADWTWGKSQQQAFEIVKQKLTSAASLSYFDKNKDTELWVDASPTGLGAILIQRSQEKPSIIAFASHALNTTESNYSHIEKEALAMSWAIHHFHLYLYGKTFKVFTDHKPLIYMFNNKNDHCLSARLERWKFKLQNYEYEVLYKPGHNNPSDYLSRHPVNNKNEMNKLAENYVNFVTSHSIPKTITAKDIQEHTKQDITLQHVIKCIKAGSWTTLNKNLDENQFKALQKVKIELSTNEEGNILLRGTRLVLPTSLQARVLNIAHVSHQGISRTKSLLREKVWFPGLDKAVEKMIQECSMCQAVTNQNSKPPLCPSEIPKGPWDTINIDHKGPLPNGQYLLVLLDQFSKFPLIEIVSSTSASVNIQALENIFSIFGTPTTLISDNGAPFNSQDFKSFMDNLGIQHRKITPQWPRANGSVERFNRTISKILKIAFELKQDWKQKMHRLLKDYRTTPHPNTNATPAELMFRYLPHNDLPDARHIINPIDTVSIKERADQQKKAMRQAYDAHNTAPTKTPEKGDQVLVKQQALSKMKTPFDPVPFVVTEAKGSMITAKRKDQKITRNSSHFKVIKKKEEDQDVTPESNNEEKKEEDINKSEMDMPNQQGQESRKGGGHNLRPRVKAPSRLIEQC